MAKMASLAEVLSAYPDHDWMYIHGKVTVYLDGEVVDVIELDKEVQ